MGDLFDLADLPLGFEGRQDFPPLTSLANRSRQADRSRQTGPGRQDFPPNQADRSRQTEPGRQDPSPEALGQSPGLRLSHTPGSSQDVWYHDECSK